MPHVLIIEDDASIRPLLMRALDSRGYAVSSAATGMAGLTAALDTRPDLVILDLGLPDIDGTQVLDLRIGFTDEQVEWYVDAHKRAYDALAGEFGFTDMTPDEIESLARF